MAHNLYDSLQRFTTAAGKTGQFYSLPALEKAGMGKISRLPVSIRIVLESVLRNCDGKKVTEAHVRQLAGWSPNAARTEEIPFIVARVVLQDFTGVPLLCDLAAMRGVAQRMGKNPKVIEPLVPVDLVVDHSVQVDYYGSKNALDLNMKVEFQRNAERYKFMKWGMQAFDTFKVVPPGIGIVHQVNLEYLARGVWQKDGIYYPDTLVGTDSHTTMINGIGVVGWGGGGIEAEAGMLGQPVYFLTPDVIGVHLTGALREGVTATDLVLTITQMLRKAKVVGKFVEYFGEGAASLNVADRATIANMAPEYGATMGYFPVDEETIRYFATTGRGEEQVSAFRNYFKAQGLFGMPKKGTIDYTQVLELDLGTVRASVAGPKRPQDRIDLEALKNSFLDMLQAPAPDGYGKPKRERVRVSKSPIHPKTIGGGGAQDDAPTPAMSARQNTSQVTEEEMVNNRPTPDRVPAKGLADDFPAAVRELHDGDVLIAAITSCTNTSNPSVMIAAGLLAKKAVERGLQVPAWVKTSLAPGSMVVRDYLERAGLTPYLEKLKFHIVGYGCTACIGNSGPLPEPVSQSIDENELVVASVLSGNRNFEGRINPDVRANYLMSPPLVVAFALAGRIDIDVRKDPLGQGKDGKPVYLTDIWPSQREVNEVISKSISSDMFRRSYGEVYHGDNRWRGLPVPKGETYAWENDSTYIRRAPYFDDMTLRPVPVEDIHGARVLAVLGDSVTTDHISPAGAIKKASPAGKYLQEHGVKPADFNSYGSRRGNHEVMVRGTFANVRLRNKMVPNLEGGFTRHLPDGAEVTIFEASEKYLAEAVALIVIAGKEYGAGSSRDWAAKGPRLLGVHAVIAESYERIHRSNLVGMGILPLQFRAGENAESHGLTGEEVFEIAGIRALMDKFVSGRELTVKAAANGRSKQFKALVRIDTPQEAQYYANGGILQYVLRQLLSAKPSLRPVHA